MDFANRIRDTHSKEVHEKVYQQIHTNTHRPHDQVKQLKFVMYNFGIDIINNQNENCKNWMMCDLYYSNSIDSYTSAINDPLFFH